MCEESFDTIFNMAYGWGSRPWPRGLIGKYWKYFLFIGTDNINCQILLGYWPFQTTSFQCIYLLQQNTLINIILTLTINLI